MNNIISADRAAAAAALEQTFSTVGGLLQARIAPASMVTPEGAFPAGRSLFFLDFE